MTVSSSTNRVSYAGNGSTTVFPYTYKIFDQDDLTVILRAANGTETVKLITSDYTVSGVGSAGGGNVTMLTAPATGETLVILREQDLVQELDIVPNDPFPADSLEGALDKLTFMVQQQQDALNRSIKASRTNTISSTEFTISAASRANKIFAFDASGDLSITQELGTYRDDWAASTAYNQRDIVKDGGNDNLYFCNTSHTSSGSLPISTNTDAAKWDLLLDVSAFTTLYDQFDDRYLGAKNSDPATDNDGNTLIDGALYWNTTDNRLKVYDLGNTTWEFTAPSPTEQTNINTLAAIAADVSTVAGIDSDVTAVAADATDIGTVASNIADVSTVAGISADVTAVAGDATDIGTVAADIADVSTVAGISSDVTTVAGISADVSAVAAIDSDVTTAASNIAAIIAAPTEAANAAASATSAANSAAAAAASFDSFDDRYLGVKASDPTLDNDGNALVSGALYFSSSENIMKVYDGASWIAATSAGNVSFLQYEYTATLGQTTFSGADDNSATLSYTVANLIVTLNGVVLDNGGDYTATNGTSVVLTSGAAAGDLLQVIAFKSFTVADMVPASTGGTFAGNVAVNGNLTVDTDTLFVDAASNSVGIGTATPNAPLEVTGSGTLELARFVTTTNNTPSIGIYSDGAIRAKLRASTAETALLSQGALPLLLGTNDTERARLDSSGNFLVGKTSDTFSTAGCEARPEGAIRITRSGNPVAFFNRLTSDGAIVNFYKDGTTVGSISVDGGRVILETNNDAGLGFGDSRLYPRNSGNFSDNTVDIGSASFRFDDIFATNGTIQTSDRNEKQDIEELDEAERRVAVAAKGLLRKFRWKSAVEEKGDDARIHFGIIAQDLQAAFEAEGLDAGRYAMFISSTWWEADEVIPAVDEVLDDEGNVVTEAQPERTVTNTYETAEEAPEGAVERTRMGIRYPQLLAFIIGAM
jgi:hypothetical protein